MKLYQIREKVRQNGEVILTHKEEELSIELIEAYSKNLNMYFYQIKNVSDNPFYIFTGYIEAKRMPEEYYYLEKNDIVDIGIAEYQNNSPNFKINKSDFLKLIDENILTVSKYKTLDIYDYKELKTGRKR